uniref:Uncharacterized protein n=1 Tax=Brassica campestris TaxID=3711 RepID=A0A3P5ZMU7_BRACM|nr:unnamed protein product [Brassica rapa]
MQPVMKAEDDESVRMNGIVCSRWILGTFIFVYLITLQRSTEQRMNLSIRQMIQKDKVPKFYYGLYAYENEDQTPIPSLDNTFVDHTSDYKTQNLGPSFPLKISSKTGALFPRMNQFES